MQPAAVMDHGSPRAGERPPFGAPLNLTGRFQIRAGLFPGGFIDAGTSISAGDGAAMESVLPPGRLVETGARVRDWLMLIVSETRFDSGFLPLPALGEAGVNGLSGKGLPGREPAGIVEHLALSARHHRSAGAPAAAGDRGVSHLAIDTRVPGDRGESGE